MSTALTRDDLIAWLSEWVARHLSQGAQTPVTAADIDIDRPLVELGLASRHAVSLVGDLEQLLGQSVDPTLAWQVPTLRLIAIELTEESAQVGDGSADSPTMGADGETVRHSVDPAEPLAIIGVGCRFPGGVNGPADYWRILIEGVDAVSEVPADRWEHFVADTTGQRKVADRTTRWGGFIDDVAGFDAEHFGIAPLEAEVMDPQQRLMLEVAWEAIEHAGIAPADLRGTDTGVFVGVSVSEYSHLTGRDLTSIGPYTSTGSALSINANRLSYLLDLRGPSMAIDTACSSSLVALHQASAALRSGEASAAIVGGVNLLLSPTITANFDLAGALAADGRCKPFGANADGIVRAEGAGAIVLKRLSDAKADGDRILAVVRGSAVNSDGRSNGMMAPNPAAQERVLAAAYRSAGLDPASVDYVEAHGTGTLLGDPIEARALGAVLGGAAGREHDLVIGSAKSNLGHMESAAGIAGVIKVVLAMANDQIPPSLHAESPNPHINFASERLQVATTARSWPRNSGTARAGVSGFGFGGTNAHVILDEAPRTMTQSGEDTAPAVVTLDLAGPSAIRLADRARALADQLAADQDDSVDLTALSAALGRVLRGPVQAAVVGRDRAALVAGLRSLADAEAPEAGIAVGVVEARLTQPEQDAVWVFSGYGSQWPAMGAKLLADEPVFATALETAAAQVEELSGVDVIAAVQGDVEFGSVAEHQVAIFCVQVALASLWRSRGVEPAAVIGHSMGEVAAAVTAGALSLRDGVKVICVRSRLLSGVDSAGAGGMAVVDADDQMVAELSQDLPDVDVAVYGAPGQCTVAGDAAQLQTLIERLEAEGRSVWPLQVTGAGHSAAVDPILGELRDQLDGVRGRRYKVPAYSTVLDDPRAEFRPDVEYWVANARRAVRFTQAVSAAIDDGHRVFVEIAPHPVASRGVQATLEHDGVTDGIVISSLKRGTDDAVSFATALATLRLRTGRPAASGVDAAWVDAPVMPWRHERFWFTPAEGPRGVAGQGLDVDSLLGVHVELPEGGRHLWSGSISAGQWPGAAALVQAAGAAIGRPGTAQVLLHTDAPDLVDVAVTTSLASDGRCSVHLRAKAGKDWTLHASGFVGDDVISSAPVADIAVESIMVSTEGQDDPDAWMGVDALLALDPETANRELRQRLRRQVAMVMGARPESIDDHRALIDLGFDSLMATRARNAVDADFSVVLNAAMVLQGAGLEDVALHIATELGLGAPVEPVETSGAPVEPVETSGAPVELVETSGHEPMLARDPSERYIAQLFHDLLGHRDFEVPDAFGAIGGADKVQQLRERLSARFGDTLDVSGVDEHATIESLGALIHDLFEGNDGLVRVLREATDDSRAPLFFFHPAGGPTTVYLPLVEQLSPRQPAYGFERLAGAKSVEAKVEAYLPVLREIQPQGPYRLLGWSLGGVMAFELGRRLVEAGETVEFCGLIDTVIPEAAEHGDVDAALIDRFQRYSDYLAETYGSGIDLDFAELVTWDEERQVQALDKAMRDAGMNMPEGVLKHQYTSYVDAQIAEAWHRRPAPMDVTLYRAKEPNPSAAMDPRYGRTDATLGWEALCDGLEVVMVSGDHISMIDRPNIDVVADHVEKLLDRLEGLNL